MLKRVLVSAGLLLLAALICGVIALTQVAVLERAATGAKEEDAFVPSAFGAYREPAWRYQKSHPAPSASPLRVGQ